MDNTKESKSSFSLPVIFLIATVIAGGVFEFIAPLDSMRPPHEDRIVDYESSEENILSRMWQDPFQAVERHKKLFPGEPIKTGPEIKNEDVDNGLLIMPVLTAVGNYPEDIEKRLRSRYAILSALHVAGYKAENHSHIGVFSFHDKSEGDTSGEDVCCCVKTGMANNNMDYNRNHQLVPYEWFVQDSLNMNSISKCSVDKVLVLWIGDEYFHKDILGGLNRLLEIVEAPVNEVLINKCKEVIKIVDENKTIVLKKEIKELARLLQVNQIKRRIVGPSSSEVFKKIYDQIKNDNYWGIDNDLDSKLRKILLPFEYKLQDDQGIEGEITKIISKVQNYSSFLPMQP